MDKIVRQIDVPLAKKAVEDEGLYIVNEKQFYELAEISADAYKNYPLHNWVMSGDYNNKTSELIMQISLRSLVKDAVVYADSEEMNGFAVWLPPGFDGNKIIPFILNGGMGLILRYGPKIIKRLLAYEGYAMGQKKQLTNNEDWYLYNLSIRGDAQGKGIATKLLRPMLNFCDKKQKVAYLETNKQSNVGLYEHFGFELAKQGVIPNSEVLHYSMVRRPKSY